LHSGRRHEEIESGWRGGCDVGISMFSGKKEETVEDP